MNKVPIRNLFYLLSYAFELMPELDPKEVDESDYENTLELFANVLCTSSNHLIRKGLYREYLLVSEELRGIKGKIDFKSSIKKNLFNKGYAQCEYTELSYDIPHNQILVGTLTTLLRMKELRPSTIDRVEETLAKFPKISCPDIVTPLFHQIHLNQNNKAYRLPLSICQMIDESMALNEETGERHFKDILRDPKALHRIFEAFVLNFYRREMKEQYKAYGSKQLKWFGHARDLESEQKLPNMEMDVLLENQNKSIIIDTKFYGKTLTEHYDKEKVHSGNLYQIMAYLENYEKSATEAHPKPDGILLYPVIGQDVDLNYEIWGYNVRVKTVDLNKPWQAIHQELVEITS